MESGKILRKLDASESYFLFANDLSHVSQVFKVTSQIDYYMHLDLMQESLHLTRFLTLSLFFLIQNIFLPQLTKMIRLKMFNFFALSLTN